MVSRILPHRQVRERGERFGFRESRRT